MSSYESSYSGVGAMLRSDFMEAEMGRRAQKVMDEAVARAPVYEGPGEDPHRGRYKGDFSVSTTDHGGWKHDRAAGTVTDSAPEAIFVEVGARHVTRGRGGRIEEAVETYQPPHHTLLNALFSAAGD